MARLWVAAADSTTKDYEQVTLQTRDIGKILILFLDEIFSQFFYSLDSKHYQIQKMLKSILFVKFIGIY